VSDEKEYSIYVTFSGCKFVGTVRASSEEEAKEKADEEGLIDGPSFCYSCTDEAGDSSLEVENVIAEER